MRIKVYANRGDLVAHSLLYDDNISSLEELKALVWQTLGYGDKSSVNFETDVKLFRSSAYSALPVEVEYLGDLTTDDHAVMTYGKESPRIDLPSPGSSSSTIASVIAASANTSSSSSSLTGLNVLTGMGLLLPPPPPAQAQGPTSPAARVASPMRATATPKRTNSSGAPPPPPPTVGGALMASPRRVPGAAPVPLSSSLGNKASPILDSLLDFSSPDVFSPTGGGGVGGGGGSNLKDRPPPAFDKSAMGIPLTPGSSGGGGGNGSLDRSKSPLPKPRQAMTSIDGGDPVTGSRTKSPSPAPVRFTTPPGPPPGGPSGPASPAVRNISTPQKGRATAGSVVGPPPSPSPASTTSVLSSSSSSSSFFGSTVPIAPLPPVAPIAPAAPLASHPEDDAVAAYPTMGRGTKVPMRGQPPPKPNFGSSSLSATSTVNNTLAMFDLPADESASSGSGSDSSSASSSSGGLSTNRGGQVVDAYTAAYTRAMKMDPQLAQDFAAYSRSAREEVHNNNLTPASPALSSSSYASPNGSPPTPSTPSAASNPPPLSLSSLSVTVGGGVGGVGGPAYETPQLPDGVVALGWARARWDFNATDTEDLGFKRGDIICITNKNRDEDGNWWEGVLNGKEGSFPSNHVEMLSNSTMMPATPATPTPGTPLTPITPMHPTSAVTSSSSATFSFGASRISVAGHGASALSASVQSNAANNNTSSSARSAASPMKQPPPSAAVAKAEKEKEKEKEKEREKEKQQQEKEAKASHRDERRKSRTTAFVSGVLRRSSIMKQNSVRLAGGASIKVGLASLEGKFPNAVKAATANAAAAAASAASAASSAVASAVASSSTTTATTTSENSNGSGSAATGISAGAEYEVDGWGWVWGTGGWEWSPISDAAKAAHKAWVEYNANNPNATDPASGSTSPDSSSGGGGTNTPSGKLSPSKGAENSYYNFANNSLVESQTPTGDVTPKPEPSTPSTPSLSSSSMVSVNSSSGHHGGGGGGLGVPAQPNFNLMSPTPPKKQGFFGGEKASPPTVEKAGSKSGEDGSYVGEERNDELVEEDHDDRTAAQKTQASANAFDILRDKYAAGNKEGKQQGEAGGEEEHEIQPVNPMPEHRRTSLHKYTLEQYAKERFQLESRGLFGKPLDVKHLTSWQKKKIEQPLHRGLDDKDAEEAIENFNDILVFMGDRKGGKEKPTYMEAVAAILERGIHGSEKLRDEIWCQLCKQTRYNPKTASQTLGWQLVCVCSGVFAPSTLLLHFVSVHLSATFAFLPEHRPFITYVRETLPITIANGTRLFSPSHDEIDAVMQLKKLFVKVELLDHQDMTLYVGPQTTAQDVAKMVTDELHMDLPTFEGEPCFGISQVAHEDGVFIMESSLANNSRILDVIAGWLFAQIEATMAKERSKESIWKDVQSELAFKLVFKARLFVFDILREEHLNKDGLTMYFMQGLHDVVNLFYPTKEKDALMLGGLAAQAKFGADLRSTHMISDRLADFLPSKYLNQMLTMLGSTELVQSREAVSKDPSMSPKLHKKNVMSVTDRIGSFFGKKESDEHKAAELQRKQKEETIRYAIAEKVLAARKQFQDVPKETAMRMYLDFLFKLPHYGVQTFNVVYCVSCKHEDFDFEEMQLKGAHTKGKSKNLLTEPIEYLLGISEKGILFLNEETRGLKKHERLSNVSVEKVGFTKDLFWYISGNPARFEQMKVHVFSSTQGKKMKQLLTTYKKLPYNFDKFDDNATSSKSDS